MEEYLESMRKLNFNTKKQINLSGFTSNKYITTSTIGNKLNVTYIQKGIEDKDIKRDSLRNRISDEEDLEQIEYLIEDLK